VAEGAYVFITGRRKEELDKAVEAIGSGVTAVQGDVSQLDDLDPFSAREGDVQLTGGDWPGVGAGPRALELWGFLGSCRPLR
jgi:NAD(P)-dependent dehydrogenase (short-subunit alcohol dehydrogenase family)